MYIRPDATLEDIQLWWLCDKEDGKDAAFFLSEAMRQFPQYENDLVEFVTAYHLSGGGR